MHFEYAIFNDQEEADRCDQRIELLKSEIWKGNWFEFHYAKSSNRIRSDFFKAVAPYDFFYYWIVINKEYLSDEILGMKESFYKYVSGLVFENAKDKISNAHVIIDKSAWGDFEKQSAINRKYTRPDKPNYLWLVNHREITVQFRPKEKSTSTPLW